jgi:16S rRNA (uracil1498-N3)-methyltransferase
MRLTRVHIDAELHSGRQVTVEGSAGNHIARVLRLRAGDALTLFNGQGGEYGASIAEIRRDGVLVTVLEHREVERESALQLVLAQGISRGDRMDWVVQKATELGVWRIVPVFTERSVVHLDDKQAAKKVQHWRSIAIAACEQSGRNRLPDIDPPLGLFDLLERQRAGTASSAAGSSSARAAGGPGAHPVSSAGLGTALLLSPGAELRLSDIPAHDTGVTVLIGPEGGLTDIEQETAIKSGYTPVRLGPRVLRTETAAVSALTLLQQRFGDL